MSITSISDSPNEKKNYVCYFCEEEVTFSLPSKEVMKVLEGGPVQAQWRHVSTGAVMCHCFAIPSNIEVAT